MKDKKNITERFTNSHLLYRQVIGYIGFFLPVVLVAGNVIFSSSVENTISAYYHTIMGDVFVGALWALGWFLITYKGYDKVDNFVSGISGISAIGLTLFPTAIEHGFHYAAPPWVGSLHYIFAAIFLFSLAIFSSFLFTKTGVKNKKDIGAGKKIRNRWYRYLGFAIFIFVALFPVLVLSGLDKRWEVIKPLLVLETLAVWAFSASWAIKGEFLVFASLKDEGPG